MNNMSKEHEDFLSAARQPVLGLKGLKRHFTQGQTRLDVLKGVDLDIRPGEIVALIGPSGAGKSTLLHIAGLLERPDEGEVYIGGVACSSLSDQARAKYRLSCLGFVYQYHNLLPDFDALENVRIPQMIAGDFSKDAEQRALWLLTSLGLAPRLKHRPSQLSGGEQQRVAIARALANRPKLLLADEPTGNLDPTTSHIVFEELLKLVRETGLSAIIATHNTELAARMDRRITLRDGRLIQISQTIL